MSVAANEHYHTASKQDDALHEVEALISRYYSEFLETSTLLEALEYHFASGGSRTRVGITLQCCDALGVEAKDAHIIACISELLHNASLIHDDIQDKDLKRRGKLSLWSRFDEATAILAGDHLISCAYRAAADITHANNIAKIIQHIHGAIARTVVGQKRDLSEPLDSIATYEAIALGKSGPLLELAIALPLIYQDATPAVMHAAADFAGHYAVAYQINDDIHDIAEDLKRSPQQVRPNIVALCDGLSEDARISDAISQGLSHCAKAQRAANALTVECRQVVLTILHKLYMQLDEHPLCKKQL